MYQFINRHHILSRSDFLTLYLRYTVKPVLRGHPRDAKTLVTPYPLMQVHLHCNLVNGTWKMWLLKTGDPLIEVTT